jgi:ATP/maltotriose-dependent transcriptional regulator MalT
LCDAVTDHDNGKSTLEVLERANLFVVPLDDRRRWYRYHHLFADVLRARLLDEQPEYVPELHRRASGWFERNGEASEAIRHALAADDFSRAADLIELAAPALRRTRREAALLGWLAALPDEVLRRRPVLSNVFAGELLAAGELADVAARLQDAERWTSPLRMTTSGAEALQRCLAWHGGRAEISSPHINRLPLAWRACGGPGTTPTLSAALSHWPICELRRVVCVRPCARTSRHCSLRPSRARRSGDA